jgi:hypothetical protein
LRLPTYLHSNYTIFEDFTVENLIMAARFQDLSNVQLHMLCGLLLVANHAGLDRETMFTRLHTVNEDVVPANRITELPEATIRNLCNAMDIPAAGMAAQEMSIRLREQALKHGQAAYDAGRNDRAVDNPKDIELRELPNTTDHVQLREWRQEVESSAKTRRIWVGILELQLQTPAAVVVMSAYEAQQMEILKKALKKSLARSVMDRLSPKLENGEVRDEAHRIILWISAQFDLLGNATERRALAELENTHWRDSKADLQTWVGKLESIASRCGPNLPAGRPRLEKIRQVIFKNVGMQDPTCAQIIREHQQHEVVEAGFSLEQLTAALLKRMCVSEISGERMCQSFATEIVNEQSMKEKHEALIARAEDAERKLQSSNDRHAFLAKGGGRTNSNRQQGTKGARKGRGKNNGRQNRDEQTRSKFCHHCSRTRADHVTKSHNTADCWFKNNSSRGNDTRRDTRSVRKPADSSRRGYQGGGGRRKGDRR